MIARRPIPNVSRRARPLWNLAISRHDATRTVTSVLGGHDFSVRLRWLTSTYPLATETTPLALALLFPLV